MSSFAIRLIAATLVWGTALLGTLSIANSKADWGHGICGPWGCGPPTQAIVACHLAWFVVLSPIGVATRLWLTPARCFLVSKIVIALACLVFIGLTTVDLWTWLGTASVWQRRYVLHRIGFVVATEIDLPIIQLISVGLFLRLGIKQSRTPNLNRENTQPTEATEPAF